MADLIVEDGTNVAGANAYATLAAARLYAESRGVTLPESDEALTIALIQGADYVNSFRKQYQGQKTFETQTMQFPRKSVYVDGYKIGENTIPVEVVHASIWAASIVGAGTDLMPTSNGKEVASERVEGAVAVTYFESGDTRKQPYFTAVSNLLEPLFRSSAASGGARGILIGQRI